MRLTGPWASVVGARRKVALCGVSSSHLSAGGWRPLSLLSADALRAVWVLLMGVHGGCHMGGGLPQSLEKSPNT